MRTTVTKIASGRAARTRAAVLCALLVAAAWAAFTPRFLPVAQVAPGEVAAVRVPDAQPSWLNLRAGAELPNAGAGEAAPSQSPGLSQGRALALASADFDEDGVPDLVSGHATTTGGLLSVRRGNVDAVYPHSPEAGERKARGEFTDAPLFAASHASEVPVAAGFIGAGDFDADGHWDAVAAARGGDALFLLRGDGRGTLAAPERISLPGGVTAFSTGDVNRRDGLTDVLVGIVGADGARLLVFEHANGALRAAPESFALPAPATSVATGQLDESYETEMVVAAGDQLVLIQGRDRRTSLDAESRAQVSDANVNRVSLGIGVVSVAVGDFAGDYREEIAALSEDGTVRMLERDTETQKGEGAATQNEGAGAWRVDGAAGVSLPAGTATSAAGRQLIKAKVSSLPKDDLVVMDGDNQQLRVITSAPHDAQAEADASASLSDRRMVAASVALTGEPAAVLPMRLNTSALKSLVLLRSDGTSPVILNARAAATLTVNSNLATNTRDSFLTLNEAIRVTNGTLLVSALTAQEQAQISGAPANPGLDAIHFNIPGGGVPTITDNAQIPVITDALTLDGTTQPAGKVAIDSGNPQVVLRITAGNSTVRGMVLNGSFRGIQLATNGNNVIEGNFIGTAIDGLTARGNTGNQIEINDSTNNTIGGATAAARNILSGPETPTSNNNGVTINGPNATGNLIQGNYIGPDVTGNAVIGNRNHGIFIGCTGCINNTIGGTTVGAGNVISGNGRDTLGDQSAIRVQAAGQLIQGNIIGLNKDGTAPLASMSAGITINSVANITIGGTSPAARNVISGNGTGGVASHGIVLTPFNTTNCLIQGNYIGTNAAGTAGIRNVGHGVLIVGTKNNTVGGAVAGARNTISGNILDGVSIQRTAQGEPTGNQVQGNYIGTDVTGTLSVGNQSDGISVGEGIGGIGGINLLIGGTTPEARNLISGNRENGIVIRGDARANPNRYEGNYIGTNTLGTGALGNGQHGIFLLLNNADGQQIGGTAAGASNIIAFNGGDGIASEAGRTVGGPVLGNSIFLNSGLGIDREDDGPSANLSTRTDNAPVLTSVNTNGGTTTINGTLQQNHTAGVTYTVQFFSNDACDPSGFGEGRTFIGQTTVQIANNSAVNFTADISPAVPGGSFVTAFATGPNTSNSAAPLNITSEFSACAQVSGVTPTPTPTPTPLALFVIAPNKGGDTGSVTSTITGEGIRQGATVRLRKSGESDIVGASVLIDAPGRSLKALFDLAGRARGAWDVVATNPDNTSAVLPAAFTIEAGRAAELWLDIIGPERIRTNRDTRYFFIYGNTGNVDAEPSQFKVILPPELRLTDVQDQEGGDTPVGLSKPLVDGGDGTTTITFYDRGVPGGSSRVYALRAQATEATGKDRALTIEASGISSPELRDVVNAPVNPNINIEPQLLEETSDGFKVRVVVKDGATALGRVDYTMRITDAADESPLEVSKTVAGGSVGYRIRTAFADGPGPLRSYDLEVLATDVNALNALNAVNASLDTGDAILTAVEAYTDLNAATQDALAKQEAIEYLVDNNLLNDPATLDNLQRFTEGAEVAKLGEVAGEALPGATTEAGLKVLSGVMDQATEIAIFRYYQSSPQTMQAFENHFHITNSSDFHSDDLMRIIKQRVWREKIRQKKRFINSFTAFDPNDKVGAPGNGSAEHWVTTAEPLRYQIMFENKPTATAPAQEVVITDQLDVTKFDLDTFELGPVAFGVDKLVTPPPGLFEWTTDVDLRPSNNLVVRVGAALDKNTGIVTWRFLSLDPATGLPTEDALAGFLPPNVNAPEGDGVVFFTVRAKPGLSAGTEIRNRARIIFDENAPIDTPEWLNTIDNTRPTSLVAPLAATQPFIVFYVNWSGTDTGSGIQGFDVLVAENGGPYEVWQSDTTNTSGIFVGRPGKTYSFHAIARDGAGNVENAKTIAEATTTTPNAVVNSIDDARFFVLQHYRDFLNRDPDPAGFDFWTNNITSCGTDPQCREVKRINVSAAFFLSIEFQETGYLAHRLYQAAYGDIPAKPVPVRREEFVPDTRQIGAGVEVGVSNWEQRLEANKVAFINQFVTRPRFTSLYPQAMTAAQFVDQLNANAGGALSQSERGTLVADLSSGARSRAQVLRAVAEDETLKGVEFNEAFVLMQYFGYLGRNPDDAPDTNYDGYNFWLAKLNDFNGDFRRAEMVKAFIMSLEYRGRFGQP